MHDADEQRYIREAADRVMLKELTARYAFEVDYGATAGLGSGVEQLFVEDGWYRVPLLDFMAAGRDAIREMAVLAARARRHMHHVQSNHIFEIAGDSASGRCEFNEFVTDAAGIISYSQGWYEDDYVRDEGEWRFKSRTTHITRRIFDIMTSPEMVARGFTIIEKFKARMLTIAKFFRWIYSQEGGEDEEDIVGQLCGRSPVVGVAIACPGQG